MEIFYEGQVMWSQMDANQHMRHSAYADFAAQARLMMLEKAGLGPAVLYKMNIGPLMFREELIFLREVGLNDRLTVTCELTKSRPDGSRWSIRHELFRGDGVKAAIVNVDGAWLDMTKRKLTFLPPELSKAFMHAPRSEDYVEDVPKGKGI
jgi:acyl-CoA thioester hydrolase